MKKIDLHTHILPEHIPDWTTKFGYGNFIMLKHHMPCCAQMWQGDKMFREVNENTWNPKVRIEECDKNNVDMQVLSTVPVMFSYDAKPEDALDVAKFLNDHIANIVAEYPSRFAGLGTVPMQNTELAIQELTRCITEIGLCGVEIGSNINDENLSSPRLFPFFAAAEELGASIFVHPWNMMGKDKMSEYWLPWLVGMPGETSRAICSMIFGGVFEKFPRLKVAFAHGGGSFPATIGRIEHGFNVRPDLCAVSNNVNPRCYLGKFYVDSLVHDEYMLKYLIHLVGENRIILGSDYPFPLGEHIPGKLIVEANLAPSVQSKLLYQNALEFLNITEDIFARK